MAVAYKAEQLESIAAKLRAMPPVEKKPKDHTKQEAIKVLAKEIKAMQVRGYSLRGEGIAITTPTLKSYLQRTKPAQKSKEAKPEAGTRAVTKPSTEKRTAAPVGAKGKFIPTPDSEEI